MGKYSKSFSRALSLFLTLLSRGCRQAAWTILKLFDSHIFGAETKRYEFGATEIAAEMKRYYISNLDNKSETKRVQRSAAKRVEIVRLTTSFRTSFRENDVSNCFRKIFTRISVNIGYKTK